ncbi:MAG: hypothetical protein RR796_04935, partial [Victivallaceae bacterium]
MTSRMYEDKTNYYYRLRRLRRLPPSAITRIGVWRIPPIALITALDTPPTAPVTTLDTPPTTLLAALDTLPTAPVTTLDTPTTKLLAALGAPSTVASTAKEVASYILPTVLFTVLDIPPTTRL